MKTEITFDFKHFKLGLLELKAYSKAAFPLGMQKALEKFRRDCLEVEPKCPFKTGHMHNNHFILPPYWIGKVLVGELQVRVPYAASLHAIPGFAAVSRWGTPYTFHTPGTGSHWVSSKMQMFKEDYLNMVVSI